MEQPNIHNVIKDDLKGVTYDIVAYRKLSRQEIVMAVRHYHSNKKSKKPKKGDRITIVTIIGHND